MTAKKSKIIRLVKPAMGEARASANPWQDVTNNFENQVDYEEYVDQVNEARFFYKTEPVVSTVVNKLVEIGINDLVISKSGLTENEFRVFQSLKPDLLGFCETMAQELLLSGLVVPEVGYGQIGKDEIFKLGIKKYTKLVVPVSLWVRDPKTIKINTSLLSDKPSYYVVIPQDIIDFIKTKGKYADGRKDEELYKSIAKQYPEFIKEIARGATEILLDNENIIRRKYLSDNPYPISYISPALNALKHKRKLRRMDFSIADKVISAILHVKVGSDEYPVTDSPEDQETVEEIRRQLAFRKLSDQSTERIFQLVTNHTVNLSWVFPDTTLLSDTEKYADINQEILFGLGFPRILITGESERSGSSDPEIAMIAPVKTMESIRRKLIRVVKSIFRDVAIQNNLKPPEVEFKPLNLHRFSDFISALSKLYDTSSVSRSSMAEVLGYDFEDEVGKLATENKLLRENGLPEFGPAPFSRAPANEGGTQNTQQNTGKDSNLGDNT